MSETAAARGTVFGGWAEEYPRWRPGYPDEAVDWMLPPGCARVLEVGAGTGKLTDALVERGVDVDVVEPDGRMLAVLRARHPSVRAHEADAARLPLPDASVDAVAVADAWHWFPKPEATAEIERVLRPDGWLCCVWNVLVPHAPWQVALPGAPTGALPDDPLAMLGLDRGRAERRRFPWAWRVTPAQWRGFQSTVSHVRGAAADERAAVLDRAERLVAAACEAAGSDSVPLPHEAVCVRWFPQG